MWRIFAMKYFHCIAFEGPVERICCYILGLTEKISRDTLELNLEEFVVVKDIVYGLDPTVALVIFDEQIGS